ncbi:sensor domain-containing diguanylate cyclase [Salimicrobium halophilum]|uniref:Diguanylate cyclase (GGDEF) domain-containing protein n=1 Tax=Salimicrobium halophilum TaxID=86666 RepID=A0A1G8UYH1_9BACI|nr:diguanylate cyclase [Salimicrobium halophilum]SDJ57990.1 diguanylate cyclase (GGDEF) domain-containing protein [Salimicrobium halophilum]
MNWIDPYTFLLWVLGLGSMLIAGALLKPPRKLARTLLAMSTGLAGLFILLTVFELVSNDRSTMVMLRNFQQVPLVIIPIFLLGYAKELYREDSLKTIRMLSLMAIPTVIDLTLLFTNPFHGWMREGVTIESIWGYSEVSTQATPLNGFLGVYPFVLSLLTIFILLRNMFEVPERYRATHWVSALVITLPILSITVLPALSIEIPGLFALSYGSMALLLIIVNKRRDFNAVWPVSRQEVLENLSEGIILFDRDGRILEANRAVYTIIENIYDARHSSLIEESVSHVFEDVPYLMDPFNEERNFFYEKNGYYFDVKVMKLNDKGNDVSMMVWQDITSQKEVELQLQELATKDPLTKLLNRRAFLEMYKESPDKGEAYFLLIDIDHFKGFNDRYGHAIGDEVLKYTAYLLEKVFSGQGNSVTRLGGEEFGVFMKADADKAVRKAEEFQNLLKHDSLKISPVIEEEVTVSIGMCHVLSEDSFEDVYYSADEAMYQAKHGGRDQVRVADPV